MAKDDYRTAIIHTTKKRLLDALEEVLEPGGDVLKKVRGDSNHGPLLGKLFILQEMSSYADRELKKAWKELAAEQLIPADDDLRKDKSKRMVLESKQFSLMVSVGEPRKTLDQAWLATEASTKFDVDLAEVSKLIEKCKKEGTPPLSKEVLEAA